jgi:hypothetical protein
MVVVLLPAAEAASTLRPPLLEQLAELGVTNLSLVRDGSTTGLVLEGWALDVERAGDSVRAATGLSADVRTLTPLLQMAVSASRYRSVGKRERVAFDLVSGAERRALNENVFREMNERLERLGEEFGEDAVEFVCECADPACSAALLVPMGVYEAVRDRPRRFLVVPGHECEGVERVVEEHADYLVIEKRGEAGEVAEDTDPRQ